MNPTCKNCSYRDECPYDYCGANVCHAHYPKGNPVLMLVAALGFWALGLGILAGIAKLAGAF